jgi:long-chain acyl-CoA synthetase
MRAFFEALATSAGLRGDRVALRSATVNLTYAELFERVRAHAQWASTLPDRVGLLFSNGPEQIVCDLAFSFAGKELVPLPDFFSESQLSHIVTAAHLSDVVADPQHFARARDLGTRVHVLSADPVPADTPASDARRIIFTSGTTGTPKGVCLGSRQMLASIEALAEASGAASTDRYLSVLPNSLLLEQIAGTYLPLSVGAEICVSSGGGMHSSSAGAALAAMAERTKPTATVLVPEILELWLRELRSTGQRAPQSLRFIAVGGSPVRPSFAEAAWQQGLPVYEGYGLSECSSVVALNRPESRRRGTVGKPLSGIEVRIDHGEIVVAGPTVMDGYLGAAPYEGAYNTGDLGHFDDDGFLVVSGRKDDVIVTAAGRNINPEWVEQVFASDMNVKRCVVVEFEQDVAALIIPHDTRLCSDSKGLCDLVKFASRELPTYARPQRYLPMSDLEFKDRDLLTANGRPRRAKIKGLVAEYSSRLISQPT